MENKTKGALAALLATGLAAGGATFALWSDSADVDGGIVTSGVLDVEAIGTEAWDVSADRTDGPHIIEDIAAWRAVPGDTVELRYELDLALEGDNLVAALNETITAAVPEDAQEYVTVSTELRDSEGNVVEPSADGAYYFQAGPEGQAAGVDDAGITIVPAAIDGTADYTAVAILEFSADTPDQVLQGEELGNFASEGGVTLDQIRTSPGAFN